MAALRPAKFFSTVFGYAELLNIDKCLGVIGSGAFAASLLKAKLHPLWWILLPAAVWALHTAGRLHAVKRIPARFVNSPNQFHRDHFLMLAILTALIALGCSICALFFLPGNVLKAGIFLCTFAAIYLIQIFWGNMRFGSEVSVALVYSLGIWFVPYLRRGCALAWFHIAGFLIFALATLLSLCVNSIRQYDRYGSEKFRLSAATFSLNGIRAFVLVASWLASLAIMAILRLGIKQRVEFVVLAGFCFLLLVCATPGMMISEELTHKKKQHYQPQSDWIFSLGVFLAFIPQ